ncbi:MAG: shikimate kinase [Ruminococcus sp.]|nr:shikimate kinase [Ruminococcus sp.]MBO5384623.1 shikimate kinase [Ruminococcus sp.]MBR6670135.1 shikimate kinase [Ruminococcus sp.]
MTIFLCGFMGCGKSTIGKLLAKAMGLLYIDSDEYIVEQEKMTIPQIFEKYGEPVFRQKEAQALKLLCEKNAVISCGGGAMLNPETAEYANKNGIVVFADVPFEVCYERIKYDSNRPLVAEKGEQGLLELYNQRYPIYEKHSKIKVDCNNSPLKCVELIKSEIHTLVH